MAAASAVEVTGLGFVDQLAQQAASANAESAHDWCHAPLVAALLTPELLYAAKHLSITPRSSRTRDPGALCPPGCCRVLLRGAPPSFAAGGPIPDPQRVGFAHAFQASQLFLKLRLGFLWGRHAIRACHRTVDGHRPEPAQTVGTAARFVDAADTFLVDGIEMSNFVHPSWFEPFKHPAGTKYDHLGLLKKPRLIGTRTAFARGSKFSRSPGAAFEHRGERGLPEKRDKQLDRIVTGPHHALHNIADCGE